jgi:methionyl-tRNA formyltransferase
VRAVLCTSGGAPGRLVLEKLAASADIEIVGLLRSTRVLSARYGPVRGAWEQLRRSGLRYTCYLGCTMLRGPAVRGLPVLATRDANGAQGLQFVQSLAPDLLLSAFFNQRIVEALAAIPRLGALNIHPSLLPALKGVDPVFYARLRGAALGVTLHRISPQLDCGDIIAQRSLECPEEESVLATTARLYAKGAELLLGSLGALEAGAPGLPQGAGGEYDSWPRRAQVRALRRKGISLVRLRDLLPRAP